MRGKNSLLITSILIIAGALIGFVCNIYTFLPKNTMILRTTNTVICILLLAAGIIGIIRCHKTATICIILGAIAIISSIVFIPFIFLIGNGSAPAMMVLSGLASIVVLGFYLNGAMMNRRYSSGTRHIY